MPGVSSDSGGGALVKLLRESQGVVVYPLHHGLKSPISRLTISWSRGNSLCVSVFSAQSANDSVHEEAGGKVVEVMLGYGSVSPFALLQSRKNAASCLSKMSMSDVDWWEYIMEYGKDINAILGNQKSPSTPVIDDPKSDIAKGEERTSLKAAWELLQMFYAEKPSQSWLPHT